VSKPAAATLAATGSGRDGIQTEFRRGLLDRLLRALDDAGESYAILGDTARLPDIRSDLDLLVARPGPALAVVRAVCREAECVLANLTWHASGLRCDIAKVGADGIVRHFPGPDLITRLPGGALSADAVLARRSRDARGFWRLAPADADAISQLKAAVPWRRGLQPRRLWQRVRAPAGLAVAMIGPDGAGKSTLVERLAGELGPVFRGTERFHLTALRRPRGTAVAPHARSPRGPAASLAKLAWLTGEAWLGQLRTVWPARWRARLVLFDRHVGDIAVDPLRYRYGGPAWAARALRRMLPWPDLVLVLDVAGEVAVARKGELTREEADRQRWAFQALAAGRDAWRVIDASAAPDAVAARAIAAILDHLGRRAERWRDPARRP
jgi:thymidylate kinase